MERYKFQSGFAKPMLEFLEFKVLCGFNPDSFRFRLNTFDKFLVARGVTEPVLKRADIDAWTRKRDKESSTNHYSRVNAIKLFLSHLALRGYDVCIPRDVRYRPTGFTPYIYSESETVKYFRAVDHFTSSNPKDAVQYPVLFRILYCCGARIGETRSIQKKDIDLENSVIRLRRTKGNKERYLPMGEGLGRLMVTFAQKCFHSIADDGWVFTNSVGNRIDPKELYDNHREFLRQAGIPYLGEGKGPRIHDWRHHFATYAFKRMADSGLDMYVALPVLSAYLGHDNVFATERYVRLAIKHFPDIDKKFKAKVKAVFGDIKDENY